MSTRLSEMLEANRDLSSAPRDGSLIWLLVEYDNDAGAHPLEDADTAWTVGHNSAVFTGVDKWQLAGWDWQHDQYCEGRGKVVAWAPVRPAAPSNGDDAWRVRPLHWAKRQDQNNEEDSLYWLAETFFGEYEIELLAASEDGTVIYELSFPDGPNGYYYGLAEAQESAFKHYSDLCQRLASEALEPLPTPPAQDTREGAA